MIDVPRLKHQDRGLCRVDAGAIKRKIFGTPHEDDVGFDVVEDSRLVPEVLPREEHDGVVGRHGSNGAAVAAPISIALKRVEDGIEIAVGDRGPGVAAEDRQRALQRFVRLEKSRSRPGSGLGLSLVAAVAQMHEAELRLSDNAPGLRVDVIFRTAAGV